MAKDDTSTTKDDKQEEAIQNEEVKALQEEIIELEDKYKRALADYQNLEKRVRDDRISWIKSANRELLLQLLPVLDTLMLAAKHTKDTSVQVSVAQFLDILRTEGVEKIATEGEDFDPSTMECVAIEDGKEGQVLDEVRPGFLLHDRLLRPAQVKVGKKTSEKKKEELN